MTVLDKNQTLVPPADHFLHAVGAQGAYIWLEYHTRSWRTGYDTRYGAVMIYLNDMGREVIRTQQDVDIPLPVEPEVAPVTRWMKFKNGFFMVLIGIEEMITCRNKS
jgi:hypothetical protein